ncbi:MAG TPA: hypothetical protein VGH72_07580 [Pseudonocardia sp.]|jgi:hypothetical protein
MHETDDDAATIETSVSVPLEWITGVDGRSRWAIDSRAFGEPLDGADPYIEGPSTPDAVARLDAALDAPLPDGLELLFALQSRAELFAIEWHQGVPVQAYACSECGLQPWTYSPVDTTPDGRPLVVCDLAHRTPGRILPGHADDVI